MPTYDYECSKCKKGFEAFQSMKDDAFTVCPKEKCQMKTWGKGKVRRLLGTGAGLIFKGAGFYITDYRSEGYKSAAKNDSAVTKGDSATTKIEAPSKSESKSAESSVNKEKASVKKTASKKE